MSKGQTCNSTGEMSEVVDGMKQAQPSILLACSLGEGFFENTWIPVAHDGVFYTENALEKYLNDRVNSGFEVSLLVFSCTYSYYFFSFILALTPSKEVFWTAILIHQVWKNLISMMHMILL